MKKALIIKIGALGDLSYALPAAKALKDHLSCQVTWVVGKSCHAFLKHHAHIDHLVVIDDKKLYAKNIGLRLLELAKLYWILRQRFDCVLIMHRDKIYYRAFRALSSDAIFQLVREKSNDAHRVYVAPLTTHESYAIKKLTLKTIQYFKPQVNDINWEWDYSYISATEKKLPSHFLVLHLGGGSNTKTEFRLKCWPYWNELVTKLLDETDFNLVFVGAPSEESEYRKIETHISAEKINRCTNLIGKTHLTELVDVIRRGDFFIGVDSGPLHIADSLNKKSIGLFGPTSTISWGLLNKESKTLRHQVPCSPCYRDDGIFPACGFQHQCMTLLTADGVFAEISQWITRN